MTCREAETLIFAARDGALVESQRASLAEHVAHCEACRRLQAELATAAGVWRARDAAVRVPAVEVEWHAIRRRIRGEVLETTTATAWKRWLRPLAWSFSTAAAALMLAVFVAPDWFRSQPTTARPDSSYVSYVQVFNTSDEAMVYEDAESGWLVVWVANDPAATTGT
jgi:anti-sigma factor RsiW